MSTVHAGQAPELELEVQKSHQHTSVVSSSRSVYLA
jgi:hypothetical protein